MALLPSEEQALQNFKSTAADPLPIYLDAVRKLINNGFAEDAAKHLIALDQKTKAGFENDLALYGGNFQTAKRNKLSGLTSEAGFEMAQARYQAALLTVVEQMPDRLALNTRLNSSPPAFTYKILEPQNFERVLAGADNLYRIAWLEDALQNARTVCRVVCADGNKGTGFLTSSGHIFTNNHVLKSADVAQTARVEFNFRVGRDGKTEKRTIYELDAADFVTSDQHELDFARVRVKDRADAPLSHWGAVEFDADAVPAVGDAVTIIQHPGGEDLQIALDANDVISLWDRFVFYTSPTLPGSSGSPVFNKDWKVVALHHAGFEETTVDAQGTRRGANRGILFRDIFAHLKSIGKL